MTAAQSIVVRDLGKEYTIVSADSAFQYDLLRDTVTSAARSLVRGRRNGGGAVRRPSTFWALKDVTLSVPRGQVAGIIGRNGAGKSTLLKILSRITRPTEGAADMFGRVGSLLEVGTGFHPELSGRENIFLNGAILGMRRAEIARSFDAIVDFSGVETFLDTPVKRYSSGMYVRLAFAVAAHLETEILLVDEVLAVGDAEFQRKCLGKMQSVVREGRTVLFVSHNLAAVKSLCQRAVWIDRGRVRLDGDVDQVIDAYLLDAAPATAGGAIPASTPRVGSGEAIVRRVIITTADGSGKRDFHLGEPVSVTLELQVQEPIQEAVVEVGFSALDGTRVASLFSVDGGKPPLKLEIGVWTCRLDVATTLLPRTYHVDVGVHHARYGATIDWLDRVASFSVMNVSRDGHDSHFPSLTRGFFRPDAEWHVERRTDLSAIK